MKERFGTLGITVYFLIFIMIIILLAVFWKEKYEPPRQPINFSHQIHVTRVGLPCTHCHTTVEKSPAAGIPSVQTCMNCHRSVATDKPEIQKLTKFWEDKMPIPWERVYVLPARKYVYFSHERHIKADLECSACHGHVEIMPVMKKVRNLEMGWCVSCHRANNASTDCATCHK
ncbi:MAG: cytochrome c3 family protein [Calditrichia bacterium]